jgi:uncharacterized protein involved in outer membrane biogenesis
MKTARSRTIAIAALLVVLAVPAIALAVLHNYDWNRARPWLNARATEAIGRPFAVAGDLSLTWSTEPGQSLEGWRAWMPWPRLVAKDIHVGNPLPPGAGPVAASDMASLREVSFALNPFALLQKKISIPLLSFDTPSVNLVRTADGANNWTFPASDKPNAWRLDIQAVRFSKGSIHLVDALKHADLTMTLDTLESDPVYGMAWKLGGRFNGEVANGEGKTGAVLSLQNQVKPFPILADLRVGKTTIAVVGTLTKPSNLAALDMRVKFSSVSMARLEALTGIVLPETPPFFTEGHLVATLQPGAQHWTYKDFHGRVGNSDINGVLEFQSARPRPKLSGVVVSKLLQFSDLGALVGADSSASKRTRGATVVQPAGKVFPVEPFVTQRWNAIDADIKFNAEKIVRNKDLPIDKLNTHLLLNDGVLRLSPLNFNVAGGSISSEIKLDSGGGIGKNAIRGEIKAAARGLSVKRLFPSVALLKESAGEINGDASLSAVGDSVASLMAGANGEFKTFISKGTVSKLLLEKMGLNLGNVALAAITGDSQVQLNCLASDFSVTKGLMHARSFIIDTETTLLDVTGDINLAREQLDLTIKPGSKGLRVFSLRAPLYVKGSFKDPAVSVDRGVMALKAGGAIALAVLAPVTAVLPLINAGRRDDSNDCARLLAAARVKPVAPAPGKRSAAQGKPAPARSAGAGAGP